MTSFEQPPLFDLGAGESLRDNGTTAAGSTTAGADEWRSDADAALEVLAAGGKDFSADDLVLYAGPPPHPNMLGAVFLAASRRHLIYCTGITKGQRASAHARMQRLWRGTAHAG